MTGTGGFVWVGVRFAGWDWSIDLGSCSTCRVKREEKREYIDSKTCASAIFAPIPAFALITCTVRPPFHPFLGVLVSDVWT